ncbi:putative phenylacetic acid degradation protein with thioesterase/thiol ester dehydrase-isomerase domain (Modular protein) [Xenorhabdus nematophila F1]|nr:putative phenylacetic acid degradation protein with thioesterase/thiol ester dehydrase-isomerase domain (Modular protein) [Xenorhabdus nematophila F1]CEK25453.1 putative phenylacetic acid degradation protein with thioesterase/thiol ester dehydrase-isomerase domain (modular protein) [Xenorhabdus nematophila AN6/1]
MKAISTKTITRGAAMCNHPASQQARHCIEALYAKDICAQSMGIYIEHIDVGIARLSMIVRPNMLNGHQRCHGGILFSLADTAFAYACNSEGLATVASGGGIDFIRPALLSDHLTATASVQHQGQTTGLYDVGIINQEGKTVALFRGRAHRLCHSVLDHPPKNTQENYIQKNYIQKNSLQENTLQENKPGEKS